MTLNDVPWVTFALTSAMVVVYLISPEITPLNYTLLAPWMHADFGHLWQNLLIFVVLGAWVERRVGLLTYFFFVVMIPYLALYFPIIFEYGGLSRGASGLTMALTGYVVPVLLIGLSERIDSFEFDVDEVAVGLALLLVLVYLTADSWITIQRFVSLEPRPPGVSVSSHMSGLVLGGLWFGWRVVRHGLVDA